MPNSMIVRTGALGEGVTVAVARTDHGWLIAIADSVPEGSAEEQFALASARKAIGGYLLGMEQPEGGRDVFDLGPQVAGPLRPLPDPPPRCAPRWVDLQHRAVAASIAPLTALAAMVAGFQNMLAPLGG